MPMTEAQRKATLDAINEHCRFINRWTTQEARRPEWLRSAETAQRIAAYQRKVAELWARLLSEPEAVAYINGSESPLTSAEG